MSFADSNIYQKRRLCAIILAEKLYDSSRTRASEDDKEWLLMQDLSFLDEDVDWIVARAEAIIFKLNQDKKAPATKMEFEKEAKAINKIFDCIPLTIENINTLSFQSRNKASQNLIKAGKHIEKWEKTKIDAKDNAITTRCTQKQNNLNRIVIIDIMLFIIGYAAIASRFSSRDIVEGTKAYLILFPIVFIPASFISAKLAPDIFKKFAIAFLSATILMLLYVFQLANFYTPLMKLVVCGICVYSAVKLKTEWARWIFGVLAVLYNPVFQIKLAGIGYDENDEIWIFINIATYIFMWATLLFENKKYSNLLHEQAEGQ